MPSPPAAHAAYLKDASERYRASYEALGQAVRRVFPKAGPVFAWGMPGWTVLRPKGAPMPGREGTIDPTRVFIGFVERKAGLTLHLWYPGDDVLFEGHKAALGAAGLKVMRGCLAFNRKGDFPVAAVEALLEDVRARDAPTR